MNKKSGSKPKATSEGKEVYVSFNRDEWAALEQLGFRERWAYAQLKWLANFKTGMVGNFRKQKITYTSLAQLVTAPGVQGRGMGNIDDTQAADFLHRMQAVGLVGSIATRANGGLCFDLPLSPMDRTPVKAQPVTESADPISPDQVAPEAGFSPDGDVPPFDETPTTTRGSESLPPLVSVMTLKESNINTDGAPSATAEAAPPSRATGAAAVLEIPAAPPQSARKLTARDIQEVIADDFTYCDADTPESLALYQSWAQAGLTLDDLQAAMLSLEKDPAQPKQTPANLAAKLWPLVVDAWTDRMAA